MGRTIMVTVKQTSTTGAKSHRVLDGKVKMAGKSTASPKRKRGHAKVSGTLERSLRSKTGVSGKIADPGISKEAEESPGLRRSLRVRKTPEAHTSISMTRPLTKEKVNVSARKGSSKSKRKRSSVPPSTKSAKSTQTLRLNICKKKKTPVRKLKVKTQWVYVRASDFDQIYQFKIVLLYSKPKIWRRIQVPSIYNFRQLHRAIQAAMGWRGYHMHKFQTYDKTEIGIPCPEIPEIDPLDESEELIANRFSFTGEFNDRMLYEYDFGDSWTHGIQLERIFKGKDKQFYPICSEGKRACPPEDVGGLEGYYNFLKILKSPKHEEYEDMRNWADDYGWSDDPAYFNAAECDFDFS